MSRRSITAYLAAAALAVGAVPLLAQEQQSGARPNGGGQSSGSAVSRPSGGGGGGERGGSSSAGSNSGSDRGGFARQAGEAAAARERSGNDRSTGRAVPRGESSSGDRSRVSGGSSSISGGRDANDQRAVPRGARPREGREALGSAVPRGTVPGHGYSDPIYRYRYYYNYYPYGYYWPGYGYGLGYFYDPWMWGSPYGYGYYAPYSGGGYAYSQERYADLGSVRLKVKPAHAQVFVDGYFMGDIDSFDGVFQKLTLEAGARRIEIRAEGYEPVQFEVMVVPGETITYKGDLKRIQ